MTFIKRMIILTLQCLWFLAIAIPIFMYLERPPVAQYSIRQIVNEDGSLPPIGTLAKVAPGETLYIHIKALLTKDCPGEVVRIITDSTGREYPFEREERPVADEYVIEKTVPLGAYPGEAEYWGKVYWKCNWIQNIFPKEITQPPLKFEILPAKGQLPNPEQQGIFMQDPNKLSATIGE